MTKQAPTDSDRAFETILAKINGTHDGLEPLPGSLAGVRAEVRKVEVWCTIIEGLIDNLVVKLAMQSPERLQRTIKSLVEIESRMRRDAERAREATPATQGAQASQTSMK